MPRAEVGEMANEEHLRILQQGVDAWNQWREDHPNERVDLTEADLFRAHLTEADLTEVNLIGADLTEANLIGAHLSDANLTRADLSGAHTQRRTFYVILCAKLVHTIQSLLGPLFIGLFALAVRQRLKR